MPDARSKPLEAALKLALRHLDGTPASERERDELLRSISPPLGRSSTASRSSRTPRASRSSRTSPTLRAPAVRRVARSAPTASERLPLPGLRHPIQGPGASYAREALPIWALLTVGPAPEQAVLDAAYRLLRQAWGIDPSLPAVPEGARDPTSRLFSVPLLLLHPRSRDPFPFQPEAPTTWRELTARCLSWFQSYLQYARGADELANWVLVRLPPFWLLPERHPEETSPSRDRSLAGQVERYLPASDAELAGRPRPRRAQGGGTSGTK